VRIPVGRSLVLALAAFAATVPSARANVLDTVELAVLRHRIHGQLLDFTNNHQRDNRIYSPSLCQCRDVYVYLPPCYDPSLKYPVVFFLHGFAQDERSFFLAVPELDRAIRAGRMPGTIVIAVDGSINGRVGFFKTDNSSFYINSKAGNFENYLMVDIWNWAHERFPIRPEREAHVLTGASMGGGAAFDLGMRHRDRIGVVAAIFPPVNLRYVDCHNNYRANFNPCCWGWRTQVDNKREVVGVYLGGLIKIRMRSFVDPLFDWGEPAVAALSSHNPAEHLEREPIRNGELAMYIAYGMRDQFNIDAQVQSFVAIAQRNGIEVTTHCLAHGGHDLRTAYRLMPGTIEWIGMKLQPYGPTR
jgi:S-formylglutathione hydrolase FrmB